MSKLLTKHFFYQDGSWKNLKYEGYLQKTKLFLPFLELFSKIYIYIIKIEFDADVHFFCFWSEIFFGGKLGQEKNQNCWFNMKVNT